MKKYFCLILLQLVIMSAYAQNANVIRQLKEFYRSGPESIFVHTDRDFYFNDETIWYKVYLSNSSQYTGDPSIVVYVEITDQNGTPLVRNKQKLNDGLGFGNIVLPDDLPAGVYIFQAYTMSTREISQLTFKKEFPVLNVANLGKQLGSDGISDSRSVCNGSLMCSREGSDLKVNVASNIEGILIGHSKGKVLFSHDVTDIDMPHIVKGITDDEVVVALFDKNQKLQCETFVPGDHASGYSLYVDYDAAVSASKNATITLTLRDSLGNSAGGNFSVSIRRKSDMLAPQEKYFNGTISFDELQKLPGIESLKNKERYLYPKHPNTLSPLKFAEEVMVDEAKSAPRLFTLNSTEIDRYKLISRVDSIYGRIRHEYEYLDTYLPFDNTYIPEDFQSLPTLEEFFTEIIRQGRIKRIKGKKKLILRNTENKGDIFNYKDNPLILVDGYVLTDLDAVLTLDPALIRRINLTWKTSTLSDAAVASLADNGILAIYSKSGSMPTGSASGQGIYDGFHVPFDYSAINKHHKSKENGAPAFLDLLYWNPSVELRGKQKLSYSASDDVGDYVIDVVGVTYTGELIRKRVTFAVRLNP